MDFGLPGSIPNTLPDSSNSTTLYRRALTKYLNTSP